MSRLRVTALALVCLLPAVSAAAQAPETASLRVTVLDETGAALIDAQAVLIAAGGIERSAPADDRGVATFAAIDAGAYQLTVQAAGFGSSTRSVAVRRGVNQSTVRLSVALEEAIIVSEASAAERRDNGFTQTLTQEEIDTLSDDPDEMAEQLAQMAGPGAQIFVDGFGGGRLPPKDQIQQIRFHSNSYAAEYHQAGQVRVEVITRPGVGGWRGHFNAGFRDESLNARNAFATSRGAEQQRRFNVNFQGPLAQGKTSLSLSVDGNSSYDSRTIVAFTPASSINEQVRRPTEGMNATFRLEHALGPGHSLRAEYQRRSDARENLGVGDFELLEHAYSTDSATNTFRVRNTRVLGKRAFSELRIELQDQETTTLSSSVAPAVRVLEAFTSGGAGRQGIRAGREIEVAQNVDVALGKHALRVGALFEAGWWDSTQQSNVNGTFTFRSLADYESGTASTYSRIVGNPEVSYAQYQAGWYAQDDVRLRKNLSLSLGLRQEVQTHIDDRWNLAPRAAFTWTLGKTNVRGGWGVFYDWFESGTYEQTVRLDGTHQLEELIINPSVIDIGDSSGTRLPPSLITAATSLGQPTLQQASIGVERSVTEWLGLRADYMWTRGTSILRSVNVNAPDADGVRPDVTAGNISQIQSTGRTAQDRVTLNMNVRVPNRRVFGNVMYQYAHTRNVADSALSLPSDSNNPDLDWAAAAQDVRHRLFFMANVPLLAGVRAGLNVQASSALPYTVTTGRDDNGDTVFNDRPVGVERNFARGAAQWNANLRLNRSFSLGGVLPGGAGPMPMGAPPGPPPGSTSGAQRGPGGGGGEGGGPQLVMMPGANSRYRLDLYVQASNLLNHTNYNAFVGNLLSPVFGQPTSAGPARRLEIGASISF